MQNKQKKKKIYPTSVNTMSGFKNGPQSGGKNRGTVRYCPPRLYRLQASDPSMSLKERSSFWREVQRPDQLNEMVQNDDLQYEQLDPEEWVRIEDSRYNRRVDAENAALKAEIEALKAENEAIKAENEALKHQQAKLSPVSSEDVQSTPYKNAVTVAPEIIELKKTLRKIDNFFRRSNLFILLLDNFNQIIKHLCNFQECEDGEVKIEGGGSILRKMFEMFMSTSVANISENTLTIPDLDYKFYGSNAEFEEFATKVSLWITTNKLNIPGTHFIIGKMRQFTAKKLMSNGKIVEYKKFTLEVNDSSTQEVFMIDIMNVNGTIVFPCDFKVNSFSISEKGILVKDPMQIHGNGKSNFLDVLRDIKSRTTTCMTARSEWTYDDFTLNFLLRGFKMHQAGYRILCAPILEVSYCSIKYDDFLCVKLIGCNCSKQRDTNGKPVPLTINLSISTAISLYQEARKRKCCPNCRGQFTNMVCLPERSKEEVNDPFGFIKIKTDQKEPMSKSDFMSLMKRSAKISKEYKSTSMNILSEESKEVLKCLTKFSRRFMSAEESDAVLALGSDQMSSDFMFTGS